MLRVRQMTALALWPNHAQSRSPRPFLSTLVAPSARNALRILLSLYQGTSRLRVSYRLVLIWSVHRSKQWLGVFCCCVGSCPCRSSSRWTLHDTASMSLKIRTVRTVFLCLTLFVDGQRAARSYDDWTRHHCSTGSTLCRY